MVSYSPYHGQQGHMKDWHEVAAGEYHMGTTKDLVWDPCPWGLPETLAGADSHKNCKYCGPIALYSHSVIYLK